LRGSAGHQDHHQTCDNAFNKKVHATSRKKDNNQICEIVSRFFSKTFPGKMIQSG